MLTSKQRAWQKADRLGVAPDLEDDDANMPSKRQLQIAIASRLEAIRLRVIETLIANKDTIKAAQ